MPADSPYRILSTVHKDVFSGPLNEVVSGWEVKALWLATSTVIPVFVDDAHYSAENVDTAIRHAGGQSDAVHGLSG